MKVEDILTAIEENCAAVTKELDGMKQRNQALANELRIVCDKYLDDVAARRARVQEKADGLTQQLEGVEQKIKATQPALVSASLADGEAFGKLQAALADMEAQKAAIITQRELLSSAPIPGDDGLYAACEAAYQRVSVDWEQWRTEQDRIHGVAREQAKFWERLRDNTLYYPTPFADYEYRRAREYHDAPKPLQERRPEPKKAEAANLETARW